MMSTTQQQLTYDGAVDVIRNGILDLLNQNPESSGQRSIQNLKLPSTFSSVINLAKIFASNDTAALAEAVESGHIPTASIRLRCAERLLDTHPELSQKLLDAESWRKLPDINRRADHLVLSGRLALKIQNPSIQLQKPGCQTGSMML